MEDISNRNIIIMIGFAVLIVGGIIGSDIIKKTTATPTTAEETVVNDTLLNFLPNGSVLSPDTDGDGLLDWQEAFRGSDKENPDTDGDGTSDGEEVRAGRDPIVAGPNDPLTTTDGPVLFENVNYTPGSLSEGVSTNFISNYILLDEVGQLNEETVGTLETQIVDEAYNTAQIKDRYTIFDITTFPDYEKEKIVQYGNTFASILLDYYATFASIKKTDDATYIATVSAVFISFAEELSHIPTPAGAAEAHLKFINNTNRVGQAIQILNVSDQDPVRAFFALQQYEQSGNEQTQLFVDIANYFRANGILFDDNTPGVMWHNF